MLSRGLKEIKETFTYNMKRSRKPKIRSCQAIMHELIIHSLTILHCNQVSHYTLTPLTTDHTSRLSQYYNRYLRSHSHV